MRKRRRLADKLTIMFCAVLVAVSAFFYAPMDVEASAENYSDSVKLSLTPNSTREWNTVNASCLDIATLEDLGFNSDYVLLSGRLDYSVVSSKSILMRVLTNRLSVNGKEYPISYVVRPGTNNPVSSYSDYVNFNIVVDRSDFYNLDVYFSCNSFFSFTTVYDVTVDFHLSNLNLNYISDTDGGSYQQGYDAGYSAGESAGYGTGYSNGFADGEASVDTDVIYDEAFQAGKDSVNTKSYYDAGYQAGYQVAYQDGYDSGYAEGLKSVQSSSGSWQPFKFVGTNISNVKQYGTPFYVAPYGLDDMEEYASGVNGYYHNTVPSVYDGYSTINYIIPFDGVTSLDSNTFRFIMNISNLYSNFDINSGSGSFQNTLTSSEVQEAFITFNGKKYYGNIGKYAGGTQGYVNFDFIVEDVIPPVDLQTNSFLLSFVVHNTLFANINASQYKFVGASCAPYVSFNVGSSAQGYAFRVRSYVENDRTSASIKSQTDTLTDGFNDSHGNSVNNEFSSGLNDFETAEDSLFATATTGLKDFTFFDIQSVPAMVTGMSFVGSIMSGWFSQAGGASGVGIVLSILFSIMLVAMVLGLYRWYQSKGGKD